MLLEKQAKQTMEENLIIKTNSKFGNHGIERAVLTNTEQGKALSKIERAIKILNFEYFLKQSPYKEVPYINYEFKKYPNTKDPNEMMEELREESFKIRSHYDLQTLTYTYYITPQNGPYKSHIFQIQLEYNPDWYGGKNNGWWKGYVRNESKFQASRGGRENNIWIDFGYSNYKGNLKYILKSIKLYLSGMKHIIYNGSCILTPETVEGEKLQKAMEDNKKRKLEDAAEKLAQAKLEYENKIKEINSEL